MSPVLFAFGLALGCRTGGVATGEPASTGRLAASAEPPWSYDVSVTEGAERLAVRMCFAAAPPVELRPLGEDALAHIEGLGVDGRAQVLPIRDGRVSLADLGAGECVRWQVDLRAMAQDASSRTIAWVGDSVLVRQSMWLLWPATADGRARPSLTMRLPAGTRASVPWPIRSGDRDGPVTEYTMDGTVARWLGYTAFGDLHIDRFERAGAEIEIVRLDRAIASDADGVRRWIVDAVDGAAMLYGDYPRRRLQVVVVPVDGAGEGTVYFGAAARGGGSGVYLLLDADAEAAQLPGGWTTVHEFLHHGMPFVRDAWMSEGFVSYYTEIMRTRQRHRDEPAGWLALWQAFERGRSGGRGMTLDETSRRMHQVYAYQRVYWGGAAIAFDLDVTLRSRSGGAVGLDDAMRHLRACCGDAVFQYDAAELLAILDRWHGAPLFTETARRHLASSDLADIAAIYARLGMRPQGDTIVIDPAHPSAAIRAAIMAPGGR